MSTRASIKWREQTTEAPGFHLFEECFERLDLGAEAPVYLRLGGVAVHELSTTAGGASVTLELPRELAAALGLMVVTS